MVRGEDRGRVNRVVSPVTVPCPPYHILCYPARVLKDTASSARARNCCCLLADSSHGTGLRIEEAQYPPAAHQQSATAKPPSQNQRHNFLGPSFGTQVQAYLGMAQGAISPY